MRIVEVSHRHRIGEAHEDRAAAGYRRYQRRRFSVGAAAVLEFSLSRTDQMRIVEVSHWHRISDAAGARGPGPCRGTPVSAPGAFPRVRRGRSSSPDRTDHKRIVVARHGHRSGEATSARGPGPCRGTPVF
jgi:hypothetical protein